MGSGLEEGDYWRSQQRFEDVEIVLQNVEVKPRSCFETLCAYVCATIIFVTIDLLMAAR